MLKAERQTVMALVCVAILAVMVVASFEGLFGMVDEGEIIGIQLPFKKGITWHTEPGLKLRLFGKLIRYDKEFSFVFRNMDTGNVKIVGSIYINIPNDEVFLNKLAHQYGSRDSIKLKLLQPVFDRAIFRSALLMASIKNDADRREQMRFFIEDQAAIGIYRTTAKNEKNIVTVDVLSDPQNPNNYLRAEISPLLDYGLKIHDLIIHEFVFYKKNRIY
ncbi:MAG: hypothetical protein WCO05_04810 [Candidatus Moraniibacteriota bacterium]